MTSVLLCGLCPLPFENTSQNHGPGIRTWQFAWSLARAGHRVHLLAMRIPGVYQDGEGAEQETRDGLELERVEQARFFDPAFLWERIAEIGPGALVGATIYGAYALAQATSELPLWADQFGHVMAEAQAKAALEGANWPLDHFFSMTERVARRADHFSVVSHPQKWACVGELGAFARLNAQNAGHDLVSVIPCAVVPRPDQSVGTVPEIEKTWPAEAFVVLWSGGYNVWSDIDTLVHGLEAAMARSPRLHFVSTGAEIAGHDDQTYVRLRARVAASRFGDRMHLAGWVPADRVPAFVASAHLGVLAERPLYEGMLGSKNRILQWMGSGLPVLYNRIGELGDVLESERLGLTFATGGVEDLAAKLSWAAENQGQLVAMAERARRVALERFSFSATTGDLVRWVTQPGRAPDAHLGLPTSG